jgi:hypothetical protein
MRPSVDTKDPHVVAAEVQAAYLTVVPQGDRQFVPLIFGWASECFTGRYPGYQAVDARYHDFEHTLQGTLCLARLLRGRHLANTQPGLTERIVGLGLLAILLHDTGYLKQHGDTEGTGAKYTVTHVHRSMEFAADLLRRKGFSPPDIAAVRNMIQCTGLNADLTAIPFQSEEEKIAGFALGTADLLGQMAAEDYVDKLPVLYAEFAEAVRYSRPVDHFIGRFASAAELMDNTPAFWETFVQKKLDREFRGLHRFLNDPFPAGPNPYFEIIAANMERLKRVRQSAASHP